MDRIKTRMIGVIIIIILAASLTLIAALPPAANHNQPALSDSNRPMMSVASLGSISTLGQAQKAIGLNFSLPSLPTGLSPVQIRSSQTSVGLIYNSSSLPSVSAYNEGSLLVIMVRDGSTYYFPQSQTETITSIITSGNLSRTTTVTGAPQVPSTQSIVSVTVSGHDAWGLQNGGHLEWWADGVHFIILGALPLATLVQIANSMQIK